MTAARAGVTVRGRLQLCTCLQLSHRGPAEKEVLSGFGERGKRGEMYFWELASV